MGMYDDVEFRYRMPDGHVGRSYQSKSLDCTGDTYVVTPEGRLLRTYTSGCPDEIQQPVGDLNFDGELNVYESYFGQWHEYDLVFSRGDLREIQCHQTNGRLVFDPATVPKLA